MAYYDSVFDALGLRDWCDQNVEDAPTSMAALLGQLSGDGEATAEGTLPFPSLDALHESCAQIPQTRDMTAGVENAFLAAREGLKLVLDPITQPLSWMLDGALWLFTTTPWFIIVPLLIALTWLVSRSKGVTFFVAGSFLFLGVIDHLDVALQTLSINHAVAASSHLLRALNACRNISTKPTHLSTVGPMPPLITPFTLYTPTENPFTISA